MVSLRSKATFNSLRFNIAYKEMLDALKELDELTMEGRVPLRKEDRQHLRARLQVVSQSMDTMEKAWHETVTGMENRVKQVLLDSIMEEEDDT